MAFIPMSMKLTGELPEGSVKATCKYCNTEFAIPEGEKSNYNLSVCEECQGSFDKDIAAASAALMKNPTDAADAIKTALGK